MKLELKHLAPYLPYSVRYIECWKASFTNQPDLKNNRIMTPENMGVMLGKKRHRLNYAKPILRPLSDIYNLIEINGDLFTQHEKYDELFGPNDDYLFEVMNKKNGIEIEDIPNLPYYVVQWLVSLHFDIHGLIEYNLAININTLK